MKSLILLTPAVSKLPTRAAPLPKTGTCSLAAEALCPWKAESPKCTTVVSLAPQAALEENDWNLQPAADALLAQREGGAAAAALGGGAGGGLSPIAVPRGSPAVRAKPQPCWPAYSSPTPTFMRCTTCGGHSLQLDQRTLQSIVHTACQNLDPVAAPQGSV